MIGKILQGKSFAVFLELIAEQLCHFSKNQFVVQLGKVLSDWVKLKKASFVLVTEDEPEILTWRERTMILPSDT